MLFRSQEERDALRQFRRETAEGRRARKAEAAAAQAGAAAEAAAAVEAAAEAEAEAQAGCNARMSMDRLRRRSATAERHRVMVIERRARRDRVLARANDGEAGPSDVQGSTATPSRLGLV